MKKKVGSKGRYIEGLYLYCIREATDTLFLSSINGIDDKRKAFGILYEELEAVVSKVSLGWFNPQAIQAKAQEDLKWIKEKAVIHEKVIEEAMMDNGEVVGIIPMKFGTIFKEGKNLEEVLKRDHKQFKSTLEKLNGKQEWSLKVYLVDKKRLEQMLKTTSEVIEKKEKEISSMPEGMAYFMENELKEFLSKEADTELKRVQGEIFEKVKTYAEEIKEGKILEKGLTGRTESMVLNVVCLLRKEKIEGFKASASKINGLLKTKGFSLEYSGPWPPYNFV